MKTAGDIIILVKLLRFGNNFHVFFDNYSEEWNMLVSKCHVQNNHSKTAANITSIDPRDKNNTENVYSGPEFNTNHLEDSEISTQSDWIAETAIDASNTDDSYDDCALFALSKPKRLTPRNV